MLRISLYNYSTRIYVNYVIDICRIITMYNGKLNIFENSVSIYNCIYLYRRGNVRRWYINVSAIRRLCIYQRNSSANCELFNIYNLDVSYKTRTNSSQFSIKNICFLVPYINIHSFYTYTQLPFSSIPHRQNI